MTNDLLEVIRDIACKAVEAAAPVNIMVGTVINIDPYEIFVDQKFKLPEKALIIPKHLKVPYLGKTVEDNPKRVDIDNSIKINDKVVLLRKQGGQSFFVAGVIE